MPPTPKKPKKLPPRGNRGRFIKSGESVRSRAPEPELMEIPDYSPHRVGIGEPIDWQRELTREVLPPRRGSKSRAPRASKLGWGVITAGVIGFGYAFSRLPHKGR